MSKLKLYEYLAIFMGLCAVALIVVGVFIHSKLVTFIGIAIAVGMVPLINPLIKAAR